jgi:putative endonuclease
MTKLLGDKGERLAARHLKRQGYRILRRQHSTAGGEIDLIALDGDCVVFVEVKTRAGDAAGHPTEAITPDKQKKLTDLALMYLKRHGLLEQPARFDVVAVVLPGTGSAPEITHYRNAFEPVGRGQMFA